MAPRFSQFEFLNYVRFFLVAIICFPLLWLDFWLCYNMHVVDCGALHAKHTSPVHVAKLCEFRWWDDFVVRTISRATKIDRCSKFYFGFTLPFVRPESGSVHIKLMNSHKQEIDSQRTHITHDYAVCSALTGRIENIRTEKNTSKLIVVVGHFYGVWRAPRCSYSGRQTQGHLQQWEHDYWIYIYEQFLISFCDEKTWMSVLSWYWSWCAEVWWRCCAAAVIMCLWRLAWA